MVFEGTSELLRTTFNLFMFNQGAEIEMALVLGVSSAPRLVLKTFLFLFAYAV